MAKGYWVVFADVSDPEGYKEYIAANTQALAGTAPASLRAAGRPRPRRASHARASSSWSFRATRTRSRATARRNTPTR